MTTSIEQLAEWMSAPKETEYLEFKEAGNHFDNDKLGRYCVAIANEGGGHLILGVTDKLPRKVVGTKAFQNVDKSGLHILDTTGFRVDPEEIQHPDGRVLIFHIPSRPRGTAYTYGGAYWMRSGESLVPMSEDRLRKIFDEGKPEWLLEPAKKECDAAEIVALLDTQAYFDLLKIPYPSTREGVLARLESEGFILPKEGKWTITNMAAVLLAKNLETFSSSLARKAPRVVAYEGTNKTKTRSERTGQKGYAVGFENLLEFAHNLAPANKVIEETLRHDVQMFPKQALRELIANALIHQDFTISGASVMIDMYSDRIEISNPGIPPISPERFIDEYRSRNEKLADFMRRAGICEEKGEWNR
jgi:ATP-dependent DNA helicase RecG